MTVILQEYGLSYLPVPKIACTSLKTFFYEIENGFPFRSFSTSGRKWWIHDLYRSRARADQPLDAMAYHHRIAVVRDPVARLLSCYSNRVLHHRELSRDKALRPLRRAGLPYSPDLSTFVANLEGYCAAVPAIQHHAAPMVTYLGDDPAYFARIYTMSELDQLVEDVAARTGRRAPLQRLQTGGPKITADALSSAEIDRLRDFYAQDYSAFAAFL